MEYYGPLFDKIKWNTKCHVWRLISKLNLVQVILKSQCNIFPQKLLMYVLCLA